jgi:uncharacterized protein (DUF433 family)
MHAAAIAQVEIRDGVPYLTGTQTKVVEVALDQIGHGWDAEEIQEQHPHLSLSQIQSALAYYRDHQDEMDRDIEERDRRTTEILAQYDQTGLREKLEARLRAREPHP